LRDFQSKTNALKGAKIGIPAGFWAGQEGVVFFVPDQRLRYARAVRHGLVAAGTGLHVVAVMGYAG